MSAEIKYTRKYVGVIVEHRIDGSKTPLRIIFPEGRCFDIDLVTERRRAAAVRAGGCGMRYTIRLYGQERYLFEDDGRWFVEAADV